MPQEQRTKIDGEGTHEADKLIELLITMFDKKNLSEAMVAEVAVGLLLEIAADVGIEGEAYNDNVHLQITQKD